MFVQTKDVESKLQINGVNLAASGKMRHIGNFCNDCNKMVLADPDKRVPRMYVCLNVHPIVKYLANTHYMLFLTELHF